MKLHISPYVGAGPILLGSSPRQVAELDKYFGKVLNLIDGFETDTFTEQRKMINFGYKNLSLQTIIIPNSGIKPIINDIDLMQIGQLLSLVNEYDFRDPILHFANTIFLPQFGTMIFGIYDSKMDKFVPRPEEKRIVVSILARNSHDDIKNFLKPVRKN
jgi:hypothetical protein